MAANNSTSGVNPSLPSMMTSSRCLTQGITATHDFVVTSFSLLEGMMGIGELVNSGTFSVGGCDWSLSTGHEAAVRLLVLHGRTGAQLVRGSSSSSVYSTKAAKCPPKQGGGRR
ncbi:hypothetical protein BAE44_0024580 [Dichanthelium oligosanthes]|uniref:MATH domain-containing protein n=1 Tax=Dichanthelium oligosanthes TaxID=888268 RepID=A0A1E5UND7_9POAL|nr:hypothetical protein BAE44_0024580 [Dichanthelium oligosanthes]